MARITPKPVSWEASATVETLPKLPPIPPFRYTYHSTRWGWHPIRNRWYPCLGQQFIDPGVGGVDEHNRTALSDVALRERGWVVLPVDTAEYLAAIEVRGNKLRHLSKWQSVATAGTRVTEEFDEEGYYAWIDSLIARGIIPAEPEDYVKDVVLGKTREVANAESNRAKSRPSSVPVAETLNASVAAMEEVSKAPAKPVAPKKANAKAVSLKAQEAPSNG